MSRFKKGYVRPLQDVFKYINMHRGDTKLCWEWLGSCEPNPIFCWNKRRLQARKLVYALKHNIPYEKTPQITDRCGNGECCNPHHLVERYSVEQRLLGISKSKKGTYHVIIEES